MSKKAERIARFYSRMSELGFTEDEATSLRRCEMTLQRWAERECNGEIERDETTNKVHFYNTALGKRSTYTVPDRETGALNRIKGMVSARNRRFGQPDDGSEILSFHQGDPRGCALYLVRASDIPKGGELNQYYTRGFAVCY